MWIYNRLPSYRSSRSTSSISKLGPPIQSPPNDWQLGGKNEVCHWCLLCWTIECKLVDVTFWIGRLEAWANYWEPGLCLKRMGKLFEGFFDEFSEFCWHFLAINFQTLLMTLCSLWKYDRCCFQTKRVVTGPCCQDEVVVTKTAKTSLTQYLVWLPFSVLSCVSMLEAAGLLRYESQNQLKSSAFSIQAMKMQRGYWIYCKTM